MRKYLSYATEYMGTTCRVLILMGMSGVLAMGCKSDDTAAGPSPINNPPPPPPPQGKTFKGGVRPFNNGTAQTFVRISDKGDTTAFGIIISEAALSNLPKADVDVGVQFPGNGGLAPFNFATVRWSHLGHNPPGVYDEPLFAFQFFLISEATAANIASTDPDFEKKATQVPPAASIPPDYALTPAGYPVPRRGMAWSDSTAPEFHGVRFTNAFSYFFYEGSVTEMGPSVTSAFLLTRPSLTAAIKLPADVPEAGFYPTTYSIKYDAAAKEYVISLENLKVR